MSEQVSLRSPQTVAKELDISPASLRRWSDEFTDYLSKEAGAGKDRSHRRYTQTDVRTLLLIKELMNEGMTYEQVRQHLDGRSVVSVEADELIEPSAYSGTAATKIKEARNLNESTPEDEDLAIIAANNGSESPAIAFLTNTLSTLADSQKSILNSQAANRELLGVLLQDNFNLKEENNRLRERILEVERDLARNRQEDEWRREALRQELEAKIAAASQLAAQAITTANTIETPEIKAVETKPGCLGMLFGRGGTQIITTHRRRKAEGPGGPPLPGPGPMVGFPSPPAPAPQKHPKPIFPPE
jgi:DNA-binding transcriptional MerR regulator